MLAEPSAVQGANPGPSFGTDMAALGARIARCRAAAAAMAHPERHFSLQAFDLARLRARFGDRWDTLRTRAAQLLQAGLARELGPDELQVDACGDLVVAVRAALDRRMIERHGELLAAEVTARFCGTRPGGASIRVVTLPFDPSTGLAGGTVAEIVASLSRRAVRGDRGEGGSPDAVGSATPRFSPVLHLRKRLVSAYLVAAADAADDGTDGWRLRDGWALTVAAERLREPARARGPALIVPVHYATLADMRARETYLKLCHQLPPGSCRRLVLEVRDLPVGLPQARVRELLAYPRPFCLALVVRAPAPYSDLDHLAASGVRAVSLAAGEPDAATPAALALLAGRARIGGMRSWIVDVAGPVVVHAAFAAGVDHVSGEALLPALPRPGRAFLVARGR